ncbi:hypothetical protein GCM10025734_12570 [Kitasatospora paranensis]
MIGGIAQATSLTVSFGVVTALAAALIPTAGAMRQRPTADRSRQPVPANAD